MATLPSLAEVTRFAAVLKQTEGCDYTIGCGIRVVMLDANTAEEAVVAARALLREYRHNERRLVSMQILALAGTFDAPVSTWYQEFNDEDAEGVAAKQRMKDYADLVRLHEKLGLPPPAPLTA
jgi:hypothetical protein